MRGNADVIAQLNLVLKEELTAINQYFLHAEMCHNWGYHKLGGYIKKQSIDEMKHAEAVMERLLFLDGIPKMEYMDLNIGSNVKDTPVVTGSHCFPFTRLPKADWTGAPRAATWRAPSGASRWRRRTWTRGSTTSSTPTTTSSTTAAWWRWCVI